MKTKSKKNQRLFGINDCYKPKKNTKKKYVDSFRKTFHSKNRKNKPNHFKNVILFPHHSGQKRLGVEKTPSYLSPYINLKNHSLYSVKTQNNFFGDLHKLYNLNKKTDSRIINIGGDHSMTIATIADTLNKYPDAKVIYFDAHVDINTRQSSLSKNYHGMPLSFLTGLDKDNRLRFLKNKLPFENILYIGSRCLDSFEVDLVYKKNIKFLTPTDIYSHFKQSMDKILHFVGDSPIHISFDVDCLDPLEMPSTGTAVKNGLTVKNTTKIIKKLSKANLIKIDLAEVNFDIGNQKEVKISLQNILKIFKHFLQ
jgi:arginase